MKLTSVGVYIHVFDWQPFVFSGQKEAREMWAVKDCNKHRRRLMR